VLILQPSRSFALPQAQHKSSSAHLAGAAKQQAGDRLLDVVVAEDAGCDARLDVVVQLRRARKLRKLRRLLLPAAR